MEESSCEEFNAASQKDDQNRKKKGRGHTPHSGDKFKAINIK